MSKKIGILSLISGLVFLISGVAKSLDINGFSKTIALYGFENLQFLSPLIVLIEVIAGLLLVFQIYTRKIAIAGTLLLFGFTLFYSYGLLFKGIDDCGCFGQIHFLNTSPVFTFIRNIILMIFLIYVSVKSDNNYGKSNKLTVIVIIAVVGIVSFISGYGYKITNNKKEDNRAYKSVENTELQEFISISRDSTYLVFAFTYTCPHCMNSIENLKQYENFGVVDKVLALSIEDSISEQKFRKIFAPNFEIKKFAPKTLFQLTKTFPTAFYIRNDSVIAKFSGELPCAFVFSKTIIRQ
ncbi:MAG: DoxX family protein [Prevotellaceae bacterium]|jgi:uncharacterized membrane protein YphA (DoxX/SURF4 family)|nr:DoxX family protein [Prevotellaceae bacterium]